MAIDRGEQLRGAHRLHEEVVSFDAGEGQCIPGHDQHIDFLCLGAIGDDNARPVGQPSIGQNEIE